MLQSKQPLDVQMLQNEKKELTMQLDREQNEKHELMLQVGCQLLEDVHIADEHDDQSIGRGESRCG